MGIEDNEISHEWLTISNIIIDTRESYIHYALVSYKERTNVLTIEQLEYKQQQRNVMGVSTN